MQSLNLFFGPPLDLSVDTSSYQMFNILPLKKSLRFQLLYIVSTFEAAETPKPLT